MESLNSSQNNKHQINDESFSSQLTNTKIVLKPETQANNSIQKNSYQLTNNIWSKFKEITNRSLSYTKENFWNKVKDVINHSTNTNRASNRPKFNFKNINLQILQTQDYTRIFPSNASLRNINSIQNIYFPKVKNKTLNTKISAFGRQISSAANKFTSFLSSLTHKHPVQTKTEQIQSPVQPKYQQQVQTKQVQTSINNELARNLEKIYLGKNFFNNFKTSKWRTEKYYNKGLNWAESNWTNESWIDYTKKYIKAPLRAIFEDDINSGRKVYNFIVSGYNDTSAPRYILLEDGMKETLIKILANTAALTNEAKQLEENSSKTSEDAQKLSMIQNTLSLIKGTLTDISDNGTTQCSNRIKSIIENCASYLDQAESPTGDTEDIIKKMLGDIKNTALNSVEAADITDSTGHIVGSAVKPEKMINTRHKFSEAIGLPKPQEQSNSFGTIPDQVFYKAIAKNLSIKKFTESIESQLTTVADELKAKMLDDLNNEPISRDEYHAIVAAQDKQLNTKELTKQSIDELKNRIHEIIEQLKIGETNNLSQEEIDVARKELKDLIFLKKWLSSDEPFQLPLKQIRETFMYNLFTFDGFEKTSQLLSLFANTETKLLSELYIPTFLVNKNFLQLTQ